MVREWVFVGARIAFEGGSAVVDGMVAVLRRSLASGTSLAIGCIYLFCSGRIPSVGLSIEVRVVVQIEGKIKREHNVHGWDVGH